MRWGTGWLYCFGGRGLFYCAGKVKVSYIEPKRTRTYSDICARLRVSARVCARAYATARVCVFWGNVFATRSTIIMITTIKFE